MALEYKLASAVVKVVAGKIGSAIGNQITPQWKLNDDLQEIKDMLEAINAVLEEAERRSSVDAAVRLWLKQVKNVMYDISDMVDEYEANTNPSARKLTARMANEMKKVRQELEKIMEIITKQHKDFGFTGGSSSMVQQAIGISESSSNVEEAMIVGRAEDKHKILASLSGSITQEITILPIYGLGGIGKTTLARLVFNDTQFKDYYRVWVYVSRTFDLNKISNSIVSQVSEEQSQMTGKEMIQKRLAKVLAGKMILIVLDDLWEKDPSILDELKSMLTVGEGGKVVVIITTRDEGIAKKIRTVEPYKIEPLTNDMCWTIIKHTSAFDAKPNKEQLELIGREIAMKCGGVALAAQSIGYILQTMTTDEWESVKNSEIWDVHASEDESSPYYVLASLKQSYSSMPPYLKLCFAYCAIFPKGHNIDKQDLIHQWSSLGFIEPSGTFSTRQIGENYVNHLLGISFLQHSKSPLTSGKDDKGAMLLTMHDLVHSLAREVLRNELIAPDTVNSAADRNYRYALLDDFGIIHARLWAVRFLGRSEMKRFSDGAFSSAKCLRVLDLRDCSMQKLPDSIRQLGQLRYLNLSGCSGLENLPEPFRGLKNLVYLYLSGCSGLVKLPESFGELENLVYLDLSGCSGLVNLPEPFGGLKNLVYLYLSGCSGLVKLPESFGKLKNLIPHLDLSGCSGLVKLPDSFGKLEHLMHLDLSGCFGLVKLPDSFGKLENLEHLDLSFCSCFKGIPTALRGLTNLQHLNLSCCYLVEDLIHLNGLTDAWADLTKLQYLNLSMCLNPTVCYLPEEKILEYIQCISGLSSLEHLDLSHNIFLRDLPESLGELTKLHTLDLSGCIRLKRLNKWVCEMNSLKFLVTRNCRGLENYQFVVRADDGGYSSNLVQLEGVNAKGLEISCLENVKSMEEARRVRLVDNRNLERLTLAWTDCHGSVEDNALLEELVPPRNLRCLELHGYNGTCLRAWTLSLSSHLPNLVEVIMEDIPRCSSLPPLFLLPNLQQVVLRRMARITRIDASDLIGRNRAASFLRLVKFTLDDMKSLEEWKLMFPAIDELVIKSCPKLLVSARDQVMPSWGKRGGGHGVEGPSTCSTCAPVTKLVVESCEVPLSHWSFLHHLPGLHSLRCTNCSDLTTISPEIISVLSSLQSLCFSHCDSMTSLPESLGGLNSLHELQIVCCKQLQSLPDSMQHLISLQSVHFSDCESITTLPEWFGGLTSLQKLAIHKCHAIKSLPESIHELTNLKDLHIVDCPELENWLKNWCESEENKNWLARIRPK